MTEFFSADETNELSIHWFSMKYQLIAHPYVIVTLIAGAGDGGCDGGQCDHSVRCVGSTHLDPIAVLLQVQSPSGSTLGTDPTHDARECRLHAHLLHNQSLRRHVHPGMFSHCITATRINYTSGPEKNLKK